jgi:hypothetical protein
VGQVSKTSPNPHWVSTWVYIVKTNGCELLKNMPPSHNLGCMLTYPPLPYTHHQDIIFIYTHTQLVKKIREGAFAKYLNTFVGIYPMVVYFKVRV